MLLKHPESSAVSAKFNFPLSRLFHEGWNKFDLTLAICPLFQIAACACATIYDTTPSTACARRKEA